MLRLLPVLHAFATAVASPAQLIRCANAPTSAGCSFAPPPASFDVRFHFGAAGNATIRVTTAWSPSYARQFFTLVKLGFYSENPPFRVDYRNTSYKFMAQLGWNLQDGVQDVWDRMRAIPEAVAATASNTKGRVTMAMQAVQCDAAAPSDPCAPYRPACTAADYCAFNGSTQFFINFGNNSRLDAHGFAPFGEVVEGMETIDNLGRLLGNAYGELQDLCPAVPTPATSAYCIYDALGNRSGVSSADLSKPAAEAIVAKRFPLMYRARVRWAEVVS